MSNPFLTKKDPVLESVKAAMQDGEFRRQAEALVNEEFGVYSRKAVIREQLAAYDARLEEAYKCMKEGTPENIMNPNSDWAKKQAADKSNPFNQPTPNPTEVAPNIMMRGNTQGGSSSMVDKVKSLFKEGNKLADKDYDKDGKIESPKDEVWGSRFRAAKKAGKMEEGKKSWEEEVDYSAQDRAPVTKSPKGYEDPSTPKVPYSELPKTQNRAGAVIDSAKGALKEDEQIDEISQATVRSYIDKAHARATAAKSAGFKKDYSEKKGKKAEKARGEFGKRTKGLGMAGKKLAEEEQIDEISKELAGRYVKKAHYAGGMTDFKHGKIYGQELAKKGKTKESPWKKDLAKTSQKREAGIETAVNKLTGKAKVAANEEAMNEAKAGRAGAILAKIRAKHMKEDQSF